MKRMFIPLAALGLLFQAACYVEEEDFTAEQFLAISVDDDEFYADGASDCVLSATYPMGASTGQPLVITTTLPGGTAQTWMVATEARVPPADDDDPQELLRLRSNFQPGDAIVVVAAKTWTQQVICKAQRAWPTSVTLQSSANTLRSTGATSSDLTITVRRTQDAGAPSIDTRVFLKACCATDNTSTCAGWFNMPSVVSTAPTTPERIGQSLPLSALGMAILNQVDDDAAASYEEARIFAQAVTAVGQPEKTCAELNSSVDSDGALKDPTGDSTIALTTIRLVRQSM